MKAKKLTLLLLSALALTSCGGNSSYVSTEEISQVSSSEISSVSVSEEEISYENPYIVNSPWGKEVASFLYENIHAIFPYLASDYVEYELSKDSMGDPMTILYLYYNDEESATSAYESYGDTCASYGYSSFYGQDYSVDETGSILVYQLLTCDLIIKENLGLELMVVQSVKNGKDCIGIFAFNYLYIEPKTYPQLAIDQLLGENNKYVPTIPIIDQEDYTYGFTFFPSTNEDGSQYKNLEIVIKGPGYEIEGEYFNLMADILEGYGQVKVDRLDEDKYEVLYEYSEWEDGYYYLAFPTEDLTILYQFNLDDYVFVIDIYTQILI